MPPLGVPTKWASYIGLHIWSPKLSFLLWTKPCECLQVNNILAVSNARILSNWRLLSFQTYQSLQALLISGPLDCMEFVKIEVFKHISNTEKASNRHIFSFKHSTKLNYKEELKVNFRKAAIVIKTKRFPIIIKLQSFSFGTYTSNIFYAQLIKQP